MKKLIHPCIAAIVMLMAFTSAEAQTGNDLKKKFEGRWDMTITVDGKEVPSWLEIKHSGIKTLVGHFVGSGGSARPISEVIVKADSFRFEIPFQWENVDRYMIVKGQLKGESLSGAITSPEGKWNSWTAQRAPSLRGNPKVKWKKPIHLIQQNSTKGWVATGENQWVVENGILKSPKSGSNLVTEETFKDFKLHVEFRYPKGSNSGVYLRGRYEVQIMDSYGNPPVSGELGGVYGFIAPSEQVAKAPGEWQTYNITIVGRMVTVEANGKLIICNQEIPGITGGAIDSKEGNPGPIMLQGDHGPIEFRNMILTPAE